MATLKLEGFWDWTGSISWNLSYDSVFFFFPDRLSRRPVCSTREDTKKSAWSSMCRRSAGRGNAISTWPRGDRGDADGGARADDLLQGGDGWRQVQGEEAGRLSQRDGEDLRWGRLHQSNQLACLLFLVYFLSSLHNKTVLKTDI